jgi:hypothetical protein
MFFLPARDRPFPLDALSLPPLVRKQVLDQLVELALEVLNGRVRVLTHFLSRLGLGLQ